MFQGPGEYARPPPKKTPRVCAMNKNSKKNICLILCVHAEICAMKKTSKKTYAAYYFFMQNHMRNETVVKNICRILFRMKK